MFVKPIPFEKAVKKLDQRVVTPASLNSAQWQRVPVAIRERAFFSATIESARFLQDAKDSLGDFLKSSRETLPDGKVALKTGSRARFVKLMREKAISWGMGPLDPEKQGTIQDITTEGRLRLIFDTQVKQANEFAYWQDGMDPMTLQMFPAMRFFRQRPVKDPRPYHEENRGVVKRKDDLPFWISMNRDFQVPWGPWGFNSGMDTEDVGRQEAEDLGLVQPAEILDSPEKDFNEFTKASLNGLDEATQQWLRKELGDLARFDLDAVWMKAPTLPEPDLSGITDDLDRRQILRRPHSTAEEARQKLLALEKDVREKWEKIKDLEQKLKDRWRMDPAERDKIPREQWQQMKQDLQALRESLRKGENLEAHMAISLPKDQRADIRGRREGRYTKNTKEAVDNATEFLGRIMHEKKAAKTPFKVASIDGRAHYKYWANRAMIPNLEKHSLYYSTQTAVHEIMHHFEYRNPEILDAARAFLLKRKKPDEKIRKLKSFYPNHGYKNHEVAFRDEWEERGGNIYQGKVYGPDARIETTPFTEVMTMGVERLYTDPVGFAYQDPDYFNFIISTLQAIPEGTPGG